MAKLQDRYQLFINGKFVSASDGTTLDVLNFSMSRRLAAIANVTKKRCRYLSQEKLLRLLGIQPQYSIQIADIIDENREFSNC